jgi:hypothetical protein
MITVQPANDAAKGIAPHNAMKSSVEKQLRQKIPQSNPAEKIKPHATSGHHFTPSCWWAAAVR